ncbi:MAG: hypothetical protein ACJ71L_11245 [Nitrososphaeraceae archaeon]
MAILLDLVARSSNYVKFVHKPLAPLTTWVQIVKAIFLKISIARFEDGSA